MKHCLTVERRNGSSGLIIRVKGGYAKIKEKVKFF
jgi:hypothetical protein